MTSYGMVIDLSRCIGCDTCTMACKAVNGTQRGTLWNRVLKYESGKYPVSRLNFLPIMCMHCQEAECEKVCPTGATTRRDDGIIMIDQEKCMGCRYCMVACPYDARYCPDKVYTYYPRNITLYEKSRLKEHELNVVQKCDFCMERVDDGLEPACVVACLARARFFGDLDNPDSEVSKLISEKCGFVLSPELGTKPSVYYLPGR